MNKQILTFLVFLVYNLAFSQDYYPPITNYSAKEYSSDENPMSPENYAVVQDQRGVMYVGNSNGVLEYDGDDWRFIPVTYGVFVRSLAIDSNGIIYAGAYNNFGFFETKENAQLEYVSLSDSLNEDDQYFSQIMAIYANKNEVFFQAQEAVYVYNLNSKSINVIYPDDSYHTSFMMGGEFYVRERQKGLLKFKDDKLVLLEGTKGVFSTYGCFGIHNTKDSDSILIVTQELGFFKWYNDSLVPVMDPLTNEINPLKIFNSIKLSDGNLALNTFTNGVYIVNEQGDILQNINRYTGMRSNDVKSMFEDKDQNLWLGLGNGISKVNYYSPLSYFNEKSGIEGDVQAFKRHNNVFYVGTSSGLFYHADVDNQKHFQQTEFIKDQVWDFCVADNKLYVATTEGVWKESTFGMYFTGTPNFQKISTKNTNKIHFNSEKQIFIVAGTNGIDILNSNYKIIKTHDIKLSTILSIVQDPNDKRYVWIGTANSGAIRLNLSDEYSMVMYDSFDGLGFDSRAKPIVLQNKLVFGSSEGLFKFIHEDELMSDIEDSLKSDPNYYRGMFDILPFYDSIFESEILLIEKANLKTWFSSDHKIGYYDLESKTFVNKPFWGINYGRVNQFYLEDNGVLWIGCADGIIRYKKNLRKNYASTFGSLIREVSIGKDSVIYHGAGFQDSLERIDISYVNNDVKFIFSAPYFEDEHKPLHSFILEGKDNSWSDWSSNSWANYTNLHEGDYVFKVKSQNIYGRESQMASFKFTIESPWYRTIGAYISYFALFIILIIIAVKISSKRLKIKNEWLEGVVEERTKEISNKNVVLEQKNEEITEQKREIEDSINYAKRIQTAILPLDEVMRQWLPKSFVLFRPKDIVSGDFYWFSAQGDELIIVCADCTGHGVPGAFMSMIGSDRLNIIVNERHETSPGKILAELNRAIKRSLKQGGGKDSTKDGMDAAICTVNLKSNKLTYAGANRPLWIIKNKELNELKATKVAVAGFTPDDQIFEEHIIDLNSPLKFYMTSDGYADQFGGPKGKKYMVKRMKNHILEICDLDYDKQKDLLESRIVEWMNERELECEQIDDICMVGFEI